MFGCFLDTLRSSSAILLKDSFGGGADNHRAPRILSDLFDFHKWIRVYSAKMRAYSAALAEYVLFSAAEYVLFGRPGLRLAAAVAVGAGNNVSSGVTLRTHSEFVNSRWFMSKVDKEP